MLISKKVKKTRSQQVLLHFFFLVIGCASYKFYKFSQELFMHGDLPLMCLLFKAYYAISNNIIYSFWANWLIYVYDAGYETCQELVPSSLWGCFEEINYHMHSYHAY